MKFFLAMTALTLTACGPGTPEAFELTEDFYEWHCDDDGAIIVSTETYECRETGLHYLVAAAYMHDGEVFKINLKNDAPCVDSHWEETIPIQVFSYECADPGIESDVDGVTLTGYAE